MDPENGPRAGISLLWIKADRAGNIQPGKVSGRTFLQYPNRTYRKDEGEFLPGPVMTGQGDNGLKAKEGRFTLDVRNNCFCFFPL